MGIIDGLAIVYYSPLSMLSPNWPFHKKFFQDLRPMLDQLSAKLTKTIEVRVFFSFMGVAIALFLDIVVRSISILPIPMSLVFFSTPFSQAHKAWGKP